MKKYVAQYWQMMIKKPLVLTIATLLFIYQDAIAQKRHLITFCGEMVPLNQEFVQNKMINVIRSQVNVVNLPSLRKKAMYYMPMIQKYLQEYGLHPDLKYIPVVESGFSTTAESGVGARGIWQIMPATARGYSLTVQSGNDERENFSKATKVACQLMIDNHKTLKRLTGVTNWALAIAAYNFGIGNVVNAVRKQGGNYFAMNLNKETGFYVYKIIAVKELFEYPEIYNSRYGYNIFSEKSKPPKRPTGKQVTEDEIIKDIQEEVEKNANGVVEKEPEEKQILAHIEGSLKNFKDGGLVTIVLDEDLVTARSGTSFKGYSFGIQGWVIDERVYFKLGYGHDVTLLDTDLEKGILLSELKRKKQVNVILRSYIY